MKPCETLRLKERDDLLTIAGYFALEHYLGASLAFTCAHAVILTYLFIHKVT